MGEFATARKSEPHVQEGRLVGGHPEHGAGGHVREWGLNVMIGVLQQKRVKGLALKVGKSGSDF